MLDTSGLTSAYPQAIHADALWNLPHNPVRGHGIGVAVVDSGVTRYADLAGRIRANVNFNPAYHNSVDAYGHGTFVAGVIAGNGSRSHGGVIGIAPKSDLVNIRVTDDQGAANESDVVAGLQWLLENKDRYNIRVVNLSLNSTAVESPDTSPLDAAVEVLWFNGIVVVVSAGNQGQGAIYPPANDPFVITVGATDDHGTPSLIDDTIPAFSAYGATSSGVAKPDLVAPGTHILAPLPRNKTFAIMAAHPGNQVNAVYFRLSGTSMAAPMVAGAVALMLNNSPSLTPDQVKYRLMATAVHDPPVWPAYDPARAGAGYLDAQAAVLSTVQGSANTGLPASQMLWSGNNPITWGSVSWNSVSWNSVSWNSVSWNSVSWNSVSWNSDYWEP